MNIRPIEADDRALLVPIIANAGNFTEEEVETALELIDEAIEENNSGDYNIHVIEDDGAVRGYVCIGETPLTEGTYDLYWIVVDAGTRGKGYGQRLLRHAEEELRRRGGRLLLIETSSMESYQATRRFYLAAGYKEIARLPDFYKDGDDKIIYGKRVKN